MLEINRPFLGCSYYPEDWDESEMPHDIEMMRKAGITCARIGEFAWRKMEPVRGEYDFKWLHRVVDSLKEAGIRVVMGTPTATPPIWLSKEHPDVLHLNADGSRENHGGRRHCCSNNPDYLAASYAIVEKMGQEFGSDENIIGWQLDNEISSGVEGCVCPCCVKRFHRHLQEKYGTVENMNAAWNLNLFSQAYDEFDEVPAAVHAWHNPHIKFEWASAHHEADMAFIHRQAEILKKWTEAPIGTDMMPFNDLDYEKTTGPLDVVMFNHYNEPKNLNDAVFWFDFLRTLKDRPFWNTETQTTWNGSVAISQFMKPEGYCRVNSWLPVALGGEANMYWLFRQHWAGHELMHGSVITSEGRPVHTFPEIVKTAEDFGKASDVIVSTKVKSPVAIHFTSLSWLLFQQQPIFHGNDYGKSVQKVHDAVVKTGILPDVIGAEKDLSSYRLLFSPLLMTLEDRELSPRIRKFVEDGGVWVAGPMTDIRNSIGAHYTDRAMGMLEDMLGITLDAQLPSDGSVLKTAWKGGEELESGSWVELTSLPESGEALAEVTGGHSALEGKSVIGRVPFGKGQVILLGTIPSDKDLQRLVREAFRLAGVEAAETEGSLLVIPREGEGRKALILCETGNEEATVEIGTPMQDILTGETVSGKVRVAPYDVRVLVEA